MAAAEAPHVSTSRGWTEAERALGAALAQGRAAEVKALLADYALFQRFKRDAGAEGPLTYKPYVSSKPYVLQPGTRVEGLYFWGSSFLALTSAGNMGHTAPLLVDVEVRNVAVRESRLWAFRLYRVQEGVRLVDVTIDGVRNEHGLYANMAGGGDLTKPALLIRRLLARNIGSQVIQLVFRAGETGWPTADAAPGGPIIVEDSYFEDVTHWAGTRSAFSLTFFPTRNPVELRRIVIDNRRQARSRGALVCQGYETGYRRDLVVEGVTWIYGRGDRELVKLDWLDDVTIRGSHFEVAPDHPLPRLDVNGLRGRLVVEGCSGNLVLRVDADGDGTYEHVGPVSAGYSSP